MAKNSPSRLLADLPEAFVSDTRISREVSRRVAAGRLRKLASRLYTNNLDDDAEVIVRRNLWSIVAGFFPGALVADRTALEYEPASDGSVCLVTERGAEIGLPGVVLRPRRGAPPLEDDRLFMGGLHLSSSARAYLDNLRSSRARGGRLSRTLGRSAIEDALARTMASTGVAALNRLRDDARRIAPIIGREKQHVALDEIVGALGGTRSAPLSAPLARARAGGRPYDPTRLVMFENLQAALRRTPVAPRPTAMRDGVGAATLAFYEAYFSNFIEGTEFELREAADIVFRGRIPRHRPVDAHDILGVWRVVSDPAEMRRVPDEAEELLEILRRRHAAVLAERPEVDPGSFKRVSNRVGATVFVTPDAVPGTLERGFEIGRSLPTAFQRAAFVHFLVSEVHPFADGNGRLARIMMNAELVAANEERIVIPTVYRGDYLAACRALSHNNTAEPLVRMLDFAQRWTAAVHWRTVRDTERELEACNAFLTEGEAERAGKRLRLPV